MTGDGAFAPSPSFSVSEMKEVTSRPRLGAEIRFFFQRALLCFRARARFPRKRSAFSHVTSVSECFFPFCGIHKTEKAVLKLTIETGGGPEVWIAHKALRGLLLCN